MNPSRTIYLLLAAAALLAPARALAQSAVVGALGNFDAANFEGKDAHGMEIQIEGITPGDLAPSWCGNKYGCPAIVAYGTGVYVRYTSVYDSTNHVFLQTTVPHRANTPFAGTCYMGSAAYNSAGCDHFGVHLAFTAGNKATTTAYRWMFEDPANPGTLIGSANNIFVPTPVYNWPPPAVPTAPPVLVAEIEAPPPPPARQFGDATWVKTYKTDLDREVNLDELTSDNPIVPQTPAQLETEWDLVQPALPAAPGDNRRRRNRQVNSGNVNAGTRSVLRRYETYAYTGTYDPVSHEVVCGGDGSCNIPQPGELGDMLVAQMTAANVAIPSLTVTRTGSGNVSSADKAITCGSKCTSTYAVGTQVVLTAQAASNWAFTGWAGACTGTALTCMVTITDSLTTNAQFTANAPAGGGGGGGGGTGGGGGGGGTTQFTLQVGHANTGTVTSDVAGINCGNTCAAKFNSGTVVTLTATPAAGKTFVNWSGACTGTSATCAVTLNSNLSVQAVFSK